MLCINFNEDEQLLTIVTARYSTPTASDDHEIRCL